jgi:hypothetical protein
MALLLPSLLLGLGTGPAWGQGAATAAQPVQEGGRVFTGDRTVERGEVAEGIVVVGGDLRVRGEIAGDAVVVGGDLVLEEGGVVLGDAVVTGGSIVNEGGRVRGEMRTIDGRGRDVAGEVERAVRGGTGPAAAARGEARAARATARQERRSSRDGAFGPIRRGIAGIISTLALGIVLAGIGATLVFYGRPYLETVSDTIRSSTLRAGGTGLAASFLVIPAFVVLIVALAVSIVGIPFLLVAIPLYPLAVFGAAAFGLLGVAHAIGERTAEQSRDGLDLRYRNSYAYLFTGLVMLLTPLFVAHLIGMTGFLGFIGTMLRIVTWSVIWVAATVGFGAVILSLAGTRRTFVAPPPDIYFDGDDLFTEEPLRRQSNA